jgi:hypothetical protein
MYRGCRAGLANRLEPAILAAATQRRVRCIARFGDIREGGPVWHDYPSGRGTAMSVDGVYRGLIEGAAFDAALPAARPGDVPVGEALKNAPVGDDNR